MIHDEVSRADRFALDDVFLEAVGFDDPVEWADLVRERHGAACRMIWARMAKSGNARESRMTYDEWLATGKPFGAGVEDDEEAGDAQVVGGSRRPGAGRRDEE